MPYEERLKNLNIQPLIERRERGDLMQMFRITIGYDNVSLKKGINFKIPSNQLSKLQGHKYRLENGIVRNCPSRHNFFTNRVTNNLNNLPGNDVNAEGLTILI